MLSVKTLTSIIFIDNYLPLIFLPGIDERNSGNIINRDAELVLQTLFEGDPDTIVYTRTLQERLLYLE